MNYHRKIKHNEKVCHTQNLGSYTQGRGHSLARGQIHVSAITQKLLKQINLMKLHRKIKHNEKVCHTLDLGSFSHGQGHNQIRDQIVPKMVSQQ